MNMDKKNLMHIGSVFNILVAAGVYLPVNTSQCRTVNGYQQWPTLTVGHPADLIGVGVGTYMVDYD